MITETHPETDAVGIHILGQEVYFIMPSQVNPSLANNGKVKAPPFGVHLLIYPLPGNPGSNRISELAEIDLRIGIGGKVTAVISRIYIHTSL